MNKRKLITIAMITAVLTIGSGVIYYSKDNVQERAVESSQINTKLVKQQTEPKNSSVEPKQEVLPDTAKNKSETKKEPEQSQSPVLEPSKNRVAISDEKMGWYYKPNKEHKLPEVNAKGKALLDQYNGLYHGDVSGKNIYLTFDEGYENGYTPQILDALKQTNIKAAFFITGDYLRKNPELVQRMVNDGHIVGNHTYNHPSLPEVSDATVQKEIKSLSDDFAKLTGGKMQYLRPPMGEYSERSLKLTHEMGYRNVFWSVAMVDWRPDAGTPEQNKNTVMERVHDGAVVLLHAVNKANAEMLPNLINECREKGYQFHSLDEIR